MYVQQNFNDSNTNGSFFMADFQCLGKCYDSFRKQIFREIFWFYHENVFVEAILMSSLSIPPKYHNLPHGLAL